MRGEDFKALSHLCCRVRNTSTCVEKTSHDFLQTITKQKHLHMRGEDSNILW